jgi:Mn-dependent DtxR family transcriptional regulator
MVERLTEQGLLTRADGMQLTLEETGELNAEKLAHLLNSFDRLYTKRYEEYKVLTEQHHELSAHQTKKETDLRRLVDKYQRLSAANEPAEKNPLAKFISKTAQTLSRILPGR